MKKTRAQTSVCGSVCSRQGGIIILQPRAQTGKMATCCGQEKLLSYSPVPEVKEWYELFLSDRREALPSGQYCPSLASSLCASQVLQCRSSWREELPDSASEVIVLSTSQRKSSLTQVLVARLGHLLDSAGSPEPCWQLQYTDPAWWQLSTLLFQSFFLFAFICGRGRQNRSSSLDRDLECESLRIGLMCQQWISGLR